MPHDREGSSSTRISAFQPREDDQETLWPILGILAEGKRRYKVRWDGVDPATNKPWPDQWVPKIDVTDDVVAEWEALTEEEKDEKNLYEEQLEQAQKKAKPRKSSIKRTSKSAAKSGSTAPKKPPPQSSTLMESISNHTPAHKLAPKKEPASARVSPPTPLASTTRTKKRSHDEVPDEPVSKQPKPKKKRKTSHDDERGVEPISKKKKKSEGGRQNGAENVSKQKAPEKLEASHRKEEEEEEEDEPQVAGSSEAEVAHVIGAKRKHVKKAGKGKKNGEAQALKHKSKAIIESEDESEPQPQPGPSTPPRTPAQSSRKPKKRKAAGTILPDSPPFQSPRSPMRLEQEEREPSPNPFAYGESDVDTEAGGIMHPPEEEEDAAAARRRRERIKMGKARAIEEEEEEVPETQSPPRSPTRSPVKSNMKPRSSKDARALAKSNSKPLHPIPVMTPSKFAPHLPRQPDSTIENPNDSQPPPQSSAEQIEEFDSPEKPRPARNDIKAKERPLDMWSGDLLLVRGMELAEQDRQKKKLENQARGYGKLPRSTLEHIVMERTRARSESTASEHHPELLSPESDVRGESPASSPIPFPAEDDYEEGDLEYEDADESLLLGASFDNQPETQTQMDDDYDVMEALPEEEEESTQDIMQEFEVQRGMHQASLESGSEDLSTVPQIGTQRREDSPEYESPPRRPSRSKVARNRDVSKEVPPPDTSEELHAAMSLLNVKAEEIARLEALLVAERLKVEEMAREISTFKDALTRSAQTFATERKELEAELAGANSNHEADRTKWEDERRKLVAETGPSDLPATVARLETELSSAKATHEAERAEWEDFKFRYKLDLDRANERKDLADKDCARFRDEYMRASATVGMLQSDKKDLEKELGIARKQGTDGVAAVRLMFEGALKEARVQADKWQRAAEFIMEKDRRTNDDIRRKAAEQPEMRAKYMKYREKCVEMEARNGELQEELEEKEGQVDALEESLADEKERSRRFELALKDAGYNHVLLGSPSQRSIEGGASAFFAPLLPTEHEMNGLGAAAVGVGVDVGASQDPDAEVYRCQWRTTPEGTFCNLLFPSRDDLRKHMISDQHIPSADTLD